MTREKAKAKALESFQGNCGGTYIEKVWSEGFNDGWEAIAPEVRAVIEQLDALAEVCGDEGVFRRCRDRLKDPVGVAR